MYRNAMRFWKKTGWEMWFVGWKNQQRIRLPVNCLGVVFEETL